MFNAEDEYPVGTSVDLQGTFTAKDDVTLIDPTTVNVRVRFPDNSVQNFTPTRLSVGVYLYTIATTQVGYHYYRFEGSGAVVAANDRTFITRDAPTLDSPC